MLTVLSRSEIYNNREECIQAGCAEENCVSTALGTFFCDKKAPDCSRNIFGTISCEGKENIYGNRKECTEDGCDEEKCLQNVLGMFYCMDE
jgi:hypothetical protein